MEVFFKPNSKHSPEFRAKVSQEYLDGIGSVHFLADKYSIDYSTLRGWIHEYRIHGISAFCHPTDKNRTYSKELKTKCVEAALNGAGSVDDIIAQYGISIRSVLRGWIKVYNANKELRDYDSKQEVYMAQAQRKTTLEKGWEIASYCIGHNRNDKGMAKKYDVSYSQVYSWVRKYDVNGEGGLADNRERRKTGDEIEELECLKRENLRLKRQLEEKDMVVELLKKGKNTKGYKAWKGTP